MSSKPKTRWLPIPGMENRYEVDILSGAVRRLPYTRVSRLGNAINVPELIKTATRNEDGYLQVGIPLDRKGRTTERYYTWLVHRLVLMAYIGEVIGKDFVVHHIDGDRTNNNYRNLKCKTASAHAKLHMPKQFKDKVCTGCGKSFSPITRRQRFCDRSCYYAYMATQKIKRDARVCAYADCGQSFIPSKDTQTFCSYSCAAKYKVAHIKPRAAVKCRYPACTTMFIPNSSLHYFCSDFCRRAFKFGVRICGRKECGKPFVPFKKNRLYCSKSCGAFCNWEKRQEST